MRLLSKDEQDLCLRILNGHGHNNYLGNIIDHKLRGVCISYTLQPKLVKLQFTIQNQFPTDEETTGMIERINEISLDILTAVNLIKLLEKDGYIMLIQRANQVSNSSNFGGCIENMPSVCHHFSDTIVTELLLDYVNKEIVVTEEFKRFCKRNFIARDEQRFQRQITITTTALVVAIVALIANTIFNLLPKFTGGTKIKQEQIDTIKYQLRNVVERLDTLNHTVKNTAPKQDANLKFEKKDIKLKKK